VFFSYNCTDEMKQSVRQTLNIGQEALAERYLYLPTTVRRLSTEAFEFIPTRIRNVIGSWSGREASQSGREILLKSVAQAVPTYSMSCFLLSKTTCDMTMLASNMSQAPSQATTTQVLPTLTPAQVIDGPVTCSRTKKLQQEVHALLCEIHFNINENYILPKCCTLIVLRYIKEEKDKSDPE